jgi:hypothetical protein
MTEQEGSGLVTSGICTRGGNATVVGYSRYWGAPWGWRRWFIRLSDAERTGIQRARSRDSEDQRLVAFVQ